MRRDVSEQSERASIALAALMTGAVLLGGQLLRVGHDTPALCSEPRELRAVAGWSRVVACDGGPSGADTLRGPARLLFQRKLDLNRASPEALDVLPGIGPARAQAIVAARRAGPFRSLADLERVYGIGPRTAAGLRDWVEVLHAVEAPGAGATCRGSGEPRAALPSGGSESESTPPVRRLQPASECNEGREPTGEGA